MLRRCKQRAIVFFASGKIFFCAENYATRWPAEDPVEKIFQHSILESFSFFDTITGCDAVMIFTFWKRLFHFRILKQQRHEDVRELLSNGPIFRYFKIQL